MSCSCEFFFSVCWTTKILSSSYNTCSTFWSFRVLFLVYFVVCFGFLQFFFHNTDFMPILYIFLVLSYYRINLYLNDNSKFLFKLSSIRNLKYAIEITLFQEILLSKIFHKYGGYKGYSIKDLQTFFLNKTQTIWDFSSILLLAWCVQSNIYVWNSISFICPQPPPLTTRAVNRQEHS